MKSKLFISIVILFITLFSFGQVTTTISDLKVNNSASTGITFNSSSTITAKFDVNLKTNNGASNNILGNIHIYVKANASSVPLEVDWSSITFSVNYPPFVPQTTYTNKTTFTVELIKTSFFASGGVLYAEYKNNDGQKYKSADIAIAGGTKVGNTTITPGNLQIVKVTNEFKEEFKNVIYINESHDNVKLLVDLNHKVSPSSMNENERAWYSIVAYNKNGGGNETLPWFSLIVGTASSTTLTHRNVKLDLPTHFFPQKTAIYATTSLWGYNSNSNSYAVQTVKFSSRNTISAPSEIAQGQAVNFAGTNIEVVAGKVFDTRFNIYRDILVPIDGEKWYKRASANEEWELIGETLPVPYTLNTTTEFLRRSFYKGAYADSNIVKVLVTPTSQLNFICCDQLFSVNKPLETIIGNTPLNVSTYTWQNLNRNAWVDIVGANSKDYTPDSSIIGRGTSFPFRRVVKLTNGQIHYSNIVYVYVNFIPTSRYAFEENENQIDIENGNSQIQIFPNPTSDVLNVSGITSEETTFEIFDITGRQIKPSTLQQNDNLIQIDISNLPNATYFLSIQSPNGTIYKKIIKN